MKSTRERILHHLLGHPNSSISDLAKSVGINSISVRHHLTSLQAEGLVAAQEERHGVGRPRLVYFLTENGRERFPTRYLYLTNQLIDHLKARFSKEDIEDLFDSIAKDIARPELDELDGLSLENRLNSLQKFMNEEGYTMRWEKVNNEYYIYQISCPYIHISQNHSEVCNLDSSIINLFLSASTEKTSCMLNGNAHCAFHITQELAANG